MKKLNRNNESTHPYWRRSRRFRALIAKINPVVEEYLKEPYTREEENKIVTRRDIKFLEDLMNDLEYKEFELDMDKRLKKIYFTPKLPE